MRRAVESGHYLPLTVNGSGHDCLPADCCPGRIPDNCTQAFAEIPKPRHGMAPIAPTALKFPIVTAVHAVLKPLGYRKSSATFRRVIGDVVHMVEVQGSSANTSGDASFTVNIGVFAPALVDEDVRKFTKASIPEAHWRMRLGELSPSRQDLWWRVGALTGAEAAAVEISKLIERSALPALAQLPDLASLASVWKSGHSPGLTERQCAKLLSRVLISAA